MDAPPHNMPPRYNICPTDPVDVVREIDGKRELLQMRWGLVPRWWSKPLKELRAATFNARAETVETKPFFRDAFKRNRCLFRCRVITSGKIRLFNLASLGSQLTSIIASEPDRWRDRSQHILQKSFIVARQKWSNLKPNRNNQRWVG